MLKKYPDVLTTQQVANLLHISMKSVYSLLNQGKIHYKKVGRIYRIPKYSVVEYLKKT